MEYYETVKIESIRKFSELMQGTIQDVFLTNKKPSVKYILCHLGKVHTRLYMYICSIIFEYSLKIGYFPIGLLTSSGSSLRPLVLSD